MFLCAKNIRRERMSAWTAHDIEELTTCYTKGFPIKKISRILKRSPTALNKAISRFKLHALRPIKQKIQYGENGLPIPTENQKIELSYLKRLFKKCMNEEWVDFQVVIDYLLKKGISVQLLGQFNHEHEPLYAMDNKIVVPAQIMLKANRLRVENNKTPFKVQDVSL